MKRTYSEHNAAKPKDGSVENAQSSDNPWADMDRGSKTNASAMRVVPAAPDEVYLDHLEGSCSKAEMSEESVISVQDTASDIPDVSDISDDGISSDGNSGDDAKASIRRLNTRLRRTGEGGMFVMTSGVMALPAEIKTKCLEFLQADYSSDEHNPDNDPFDEYDFGTIETDGQFLFWKIDYYDLDMQYHSPDPADENVTKRVLTLMLASEY